MTEDSDDVCIVEFYLQDLLDDQEPELDSAPDTLGLKAHIGDLFTDEFEGVVERQFIQLYVQCDLPSAPPNPDLGYTYDDINITRGVILADVKDRTDPPVYFGHEVEMTDFLENYALSEHMSRRVRYMFDRLERMATPKESWLEQVSSLYNDRLVGARGIVKPRSIC